MVSGTPLSRVPRHLRDFPVGTREGRRSEDRVPSQKDTRRTDYPMSSRGDLYTERVGKGEKELAPTFPRGEGKTSGKRQKKMERPTLPPRGGSCKGGGVFFGQGERTPGLHPHPTPSALQPLSFTPLLVSFDTLSLKNFSSTPDSKEGVMGPSGVGSRPPLFCYPLPRPPPFRFSSYPSRCPSYWWRKKGEKTVRPGVGEYSLGGHMTLDHLEAATGARGGGPGRTGDDVSDLRTLVVDLGLRPATKMYLSD